MRGRLVIVLAMALGGAGPAHARFYKCMVDGKPVFSDRPCATDAETVEIHYHKADPKAAAQIQRQLQEFEQDLAAEKRQRKIRQLRRKIGRLERERDARLDLLRAKKGYAANNLAGATWEESISQEMTAVTTQYGQKIDAVRKEIDRLERH